MAGHDRARQKARCEGRTAIRREKAKCWIWDRRSKPLATIAILVLLVVVTYQGAPSIPNSSPELSPATSLPSCGPGNASRSQLYRQLEAHGVRTEQFVHACHFRSLAGSDFGHINVLVGLVMHESAASIADMVDNALRFTLPTTGVVLHLNAR